VPDREAGTTSPWVSVARATRTAAAGMLPTPRRRRSGTPAGITPTSLAAAGVPMSTPVALKELDASPLDRLDQSDWPTFEDVASSATPEATVAEPAMPAVPAVPTRPAGPVAEAAADSSASPLAGSILAPDTWRQALRTLQDRTVRR